LELYLGENLHPLHADVVSRPEHYTDRQKEIVLALHTKAPITVEPTEAELNDVILQMSRPTDLAKKSKDIMSKATTKDISDDAIMEDDKEKVPTFEDQDFGKLITII